VRRIDHIVIHHSASGLGTTAADIDRWHRERGWTGIGYHMVIEGSGKIVRGRQLFDIGAHVRGHNRNSVGICLAGDNTNLAHRWVAAQIVSLKTVLEVFGALFPDATVLGHRDMPDTETECPGLDVRRLLGLEEVT